jgi:L-2-hydroxyglutarate oxidase LhgO
VCFSADGKGFEVKTSQGSILCDYLVNAAGMHAPYLASRMPFYPERALPPVYFAKGNYFKLQGVAPPFKRLIYPIPAAGGLGVHATLDLQGRVKFGPNVEWLRYTSGQSAAGTALSAHAACSESGDVYRFPVGAAPPSDFTVSTRCVDDAGREQDTVDVFCREVRRYWPAVQREMLVPDYAGIRPKLCGPAQAAASTGSQGQDAAHRPAQGAAYHMPASADFALLGQETHGVPGLVCVFGAESPGLTASLAIARHVRDLLLLQR